MKSQYNIYMFPETELKEIKNILQQTDNNEIILEAIESLNYIVSKTYGFALKQFSFRFLLPIFDNIEFRSLVLAILTKYFIYDQYDSELIDFVISFSNNFIVESRQKFHNLISDINHIDRKSCLTAYFLHLQQVCELLVNVSQIDEECAARVLGLDISSFLSSFLVILNQSTQKQQHQQNCDHHPERNNGNQSIPANPQGKTSNHNIKQDKTKSTNTHEQTVQNSPNFPQIPPHNQARSSAFCCISLLSNALNNCILSLQSTVFQHETVVFQLISLLTDNIFALQQSKSALTFIQFSLENLCKLNFQQVQNEKFFEIQAILLRNGADFSENALINSCVDEKEVKRVVNDLLSDGFEVTDRDLRLLRIIQGMEGEWDEEGREGERIQAKVEMLTREQAE